MPHPGDQVRTMKALGEEGWPARAQHVAYIGDACVVRGSDDFDHADLTAVRGRFPGRHVTLDGDVITVWPQARSQ